MRGPLPDFVSESLSERSIVQAGYFNWQTVHRLLEAHLNRDQDNSRNLLPVLNVQLWDDMFRRGLKPPRESKPIVDESVEMIRP